MKASKFFRMLIATAILSGAMMTGFAFGQQDVDPTWYEPVPAAQGASHSHQAAGVKQQKRAKTVASSKTAAKVQAKGSAPKTKSSASL